MTTPPHVPASVDASKKESFKAKLKHVRRTLVGILGVVVVFGGYALKDGSIAHYIAAHPGLAGAIGVTLGILRALDMALNRRQGNGRQ